MIRAMQLDSGFAQAVRQGVDHLLGKISMEPAIHHENFRIIRETYLRLLKDAEQQAHEATATPINPPPYL
jgi:hypothetical protein